MSAAEKTLWIASSDEDLIRRAELELSVGCRFERIATAQINMPNFWKDCPRLPGAVLLDVGEEINWAMHVLEDMKRARVPSPVIVVTSNPSHEFGTKIVSLGISYFLPRDFAPGELAEVFASLVRRQRQKASRGSKATP